MEKARERLFLLTQGTGPAAPALTTLGQVPSLAQGGRVAALTLGNSAHLGQGRAGSPRPGLPSGSTGEQEADCRGRAGPAFCCVALSAHRRERAGDARLAPRQGSPGGPMLQCGDGAGWPRGPCPAGVDLLLHTMLSGVVLRAGTPGHAHPALASPQPIAPPRWLTPSSPVGCCPPPAQAPSVSEHLMNVSAATPPRPAGCRASAFPAQREPIARLGQAHSVPQCQRLNPHLGRWNALLSPPGSPGPMPSAPPAHPREDPSGDKRCRV